VTRLNAKPRHKYGAKPIVIDGIRFASQKEGRRYSELKLLEKAGAVSGIELQPEFPLYAWSTIAKQATHIGKYVADFRYVLRCPSGLLTDVIEDVKGFKTPVYRLKKKMAEAIYGIEIREV
jgi:hypothetical protein